MANVIQYNNLLSHGIILEYQLPLSAKRLDVMLTGYDCQGHSQAVVIELKQWDAATESSIDGCVTTYLGSRERDVLHPSVQVGQYEQYLSDCHTVFSSNEVGLSSCAFLHNLEREKAGILLRPTFEPYLSRCPLFAGDDTKTLSDYIKRQVATGCNGEVLKKVLDSKYRASKKLLDHVAEVVLEHPSFVLLDEQLVAYNAVLTAAREGYHDKRKTAIVVKGGPGTGKSVIALQLMGALSKLGYNTQHATGSRAFTGNIRKLVGNRGSVQFKYFNSYGVAEPNEIDILVMDEAHRIRESSANRFTPKTQRSALPQIDEVLRAAKVSVFFIDDRQVVRPGEVGSSALIGQAAVRANARIQEFELEAQFRCNGSDAFINWVDNTLGIRRTANILWDRSDPFELLLVDTVEELEVMIQEKAAIGNTARLVAGFCWPWSNPNKDGSLVDDVVIGGWARPWNAKPDAGRLARGVPRADFWASDPGGLNQVGCVYTAQGFEFDYCGVIIGNDFRYAPETAKWQGYREESYDSVVKRSGARYGELIAQTYRVLLTRGMKGCAIYCQDRATRSFLRSRIEN
jgi:DUF2075 family protein